MRFEGIKRVFESEDSYRQLLKNIKEENFICQTYGLSETQKAFVSFCLFEDIKGHFLYIAHNEIEARKIYEDLSTFTDKVAYFPSKESAINVDVTSSGIKQERIRTIFRILEGEDLIVVTSIDSIFYKMTPKEIIKNSKLILKKGDIVEPLDLTKNLYDLGYERVEVVEGPGQFVQRGGIIDIFPLNEEVPYRIEFFDDEIDTIRKFDIETQRSLDYEEFITVLPAREIIIRSGDVNKITNAIDVEYEKIYKNYKKNKDVQDRLKQKYNSIKEGITNFRYFEGIESFITTIYEEAENFLDYFNNPTVLLDETARLITRIKSFEEEFREIFKSMMEKGEVLPIQANWVYSAEYLLDVVNKKRCIGFNMLPRSVQDINVRAVVNFNAVVSNITSVNLEYFIDELKNRIQKNYYVLIFAGTRAKAERLTKGLKDEGIEAEYVEEVKGLIPRKVYVTYGSIKNGIEFFECRLTILSEREVYKTNKERKKQFNKKSRKIESFTDLKIGDYVVHANHGIGVFSGIKELVIEGIKRDYLVLKYQGEDTLYVPVEQLDLVQKYIGGDDNPPKINKLGTSEWAKTKKKVKESLREVAQELVALYAVRNSIEGYAFSKDTPWQKQFEDEFPYNETEDQLIAIEEIKRDMESKKPMDRLLCGDVGYGKTEVAMRAAFKAVMDGKQVAVLVPTTILAQQHYNNFKQRFSDFPVNIDMISRFRSKEEQRRTLKELSVGNVDIIIGTHRLLQKDVKFKDLGLLIVDEEQRFGVSHKEKIKLLKKNIDVLTLTATPIPRTLHMSLIGVRDISVIETPPEERYPVQTYVLEYNEFIIRDAILREISRGGQVFFVYNRVDKIKEMQAYLQRLVDGARVLIAHGQMDEDELEQVILDFVSGEADILLCTTIIETGIDMPNVNTLIVYDADRMGLSQLYQLRGRVGRSNRLAYAYFTYRKDKILTEVAEKRLKAIKEFTEFGSGFKIAMRDLEIRGAGNLLGTRQHGHMMAVGYDLYCKLLEEAVKEVKGEFTEEVETSIDILVNAHIPDDYIKDGRVKIEVYKKIAAISSIEDKQDVEDELVDRFSDIPKPVENLIMISYIKSIAQKLKIVSIKQVQKDIFLHFKDIGYIDYEKIKQLNSKFNNIVSYGSLKEPILKIRLNKFSNNQILYIIKDLLEELKNLHNEK
ncbi:transcription-repair coupling factor [Caloramator sp. ALD01]|uniref:transcription-repair coupling factor n=1 Tax=Caloramator sp. ALD01 TaxID=1031288 RepID=UPI00041AE273|nr:transcription-repair coupling factor [Caloramator sp. ALD01]